MNASADVTTRTDGDLDIVVCMMTNFTLKRREKDKEDDE